MLLLRTVKTVALKHFLVSPEGHVSSWNPYMPPLQRVRHTTMLLTGMLFHSEVVKSVAFDLLSGFFYIRRLLVAPASIIPPIRYFDFS